MTTGFETYLRTHVSLNAAEIEEIVSAAQHRSLQRNQLLLQQGQVCRHKTLILKGLLRSFGTAADGSVQQRAFSNTSQGT